MDSPETLGDIAIFAAVVREGSFTRAADKLELSTSQVSKCVNRLERTLGARLLHRPGNTRSSTSSSSSRTGTWTWFARASTWPCRIDVRCLARA